MPDAPQSGECSSRLKTQPLQQGVVVLIRRGSGASEEFLFARRAPHKEEGGLWSLVSGKIEAGESQAEALVREMREELGVRVRPGRMLFTKVTANGKYELYWWSAEIEAGEVLRIAAPEENTEFAWLTLNQLEELERQGLTYPNATQFLRHLIGLEISG